MVISTLFILIAKVIIVFTEINLCPRQMNQYSIFELKNIPKL